MLVKDLIEKLQSADPEASVCVFDMFSPPPNQFFQVSVAQTIVAQPYVDSNQDHKSGKIFMLH